jgi:hypothetical protein
MGDWQPPRASAAKSAASAAAFEEHRLKAISVVIAALMKDPIGSFHIETPPVLEQFLRRPQQLGAAQPARRAAAM